MVVSHFTATVTVRDSSDSETELVRGPHSISLSLSPSLNSFSYTESTVDGVSSFADLLIDTGGVYEITASCPNMESFTLQNIDVHELELTSMEISFNKASPSVDEDFEVTVDLYDQQHSLILSLTSVSLSSDLSTSGSTSGSTTSGSILFQIRGLVPGLLTVRATSGLVSNSSSITIYPQKLKFSTSPPLSLKRFEFFSFQISVFENTLTSLSSYGPYSISIASTPTTSLGGVLIQSTSSSLADFSSIQFLELGAFKLVASATNMDSIYSDLITVSLNYELSMTVTLPSSSYLLKYYYSFPVVVMNLTSSAPLVAGQVKLYINGTVVDTQVTDLDGKVWFSVMFEVTGKAQLVFECDVISKSESLQVQVSDNLDQLCSVAVNASACATCVENAFVVDGVCVCFHNGTYSAADGKCVCPYRSTPVNFYCIDCGFYFRASEINSSYDSNFKAIWVHFDRDVNRVGLGSCADIFIGPSYLLESNAVCSWVSSRVLKVQLDQYLDISFDLLELNPLTVQAISDKCETYIEALSITIQKTSPILVPYSVITAPDSFSLGCSESNLIISSSLSSKNVSYTWSSWASPNNSVLTTFIRLQDSSVFSIPFSLLSESLLTISLTTKFSGLDSTYSTSKQITISPNKQLTIKLNSPSLVKLKVSQSYILEASVINSCGSSDNLSYQWSVNSSSVNISKLLSPTSANKLTIPSYYLSALNFYNFQVQVSDGSLSGTGQTVIQVIQSDLIISLSRSSGSISPQSNLTIKSIITDPDDEFSVIRAQWSCIETDKACIDSKNLTLGFNETSFTLFVGDLREKALYQFMIKGFTDLKASYASVFIYVDPLVKGEVLIAGPFPKINPDYVYNVIPKFEVEGKAEFTWNIKNGVVDSSGLSLSQSFLGFREEVLGEGSDYELVIQVKSDKFEGTLTGEVTVKTNKGPTCSDIQTDFSGQYLEVLATNCIDLDDEDYPLSYQIGFEVENKTYWVTSQTGNPWSRVLQISNSSNILVRVCDSLFTCTVQSKSFTSTNQTRLLEEDHLMYLMQESRDPLKIPNLILTYITKDISYATFSYLYDQLYSFFSQLDMTLQNFEVFSNCLESILDIRSMAVEIVRNSTYLTRSVLKNVGKRLKEVEVNKLVFMYEPYVNYTSFEEIQGLLLDIADAWTTDLTPNSEVVYVGDISYARVKMNGAYYPGKYLKNSEFSVEIAKESAFSYSKVYDMTVFVLQVNESIYIITNSSISADYQNYFLQLTSLKDSNLTFKQPITLSTKNSLNSTRVSCSSKSGSCEVKKVNETHISLEIYSFSTYTIKSSQGTCSLKSAPVYIVSSISAFFLILSLWVFYKDRKYKHEHIKIFRFLTTYSLTSSFIPQHNPKRLMALSQISATFIFMLGIIGFTYDDLEDDLNTLNIETGGISIKHLARGLVALGLTQILTLLNIAIRIHANINKKLEYIAVLVNILISGIGFSIVGITCLFMCPKSFDIWIVNFGIFGPMQLLVVEPTLAIFSVKIIKKKASGVIRVTRAPDDNTTFSKDFKIIADSPAETGRHSMKFDRSQTTKSFINV